MIFKWEYENIINGSDREKEELAKPVKHFLDNHKDIIKYKWQYNEKTNDYYIIYRTSIDNKLFINENNNIIEIDFDSDMLDFVFGYIQDGNYLSVEFVKKETFYILSFCYSYGRLEYNEHWYEEDRYRYRTIRTTWTYLIDKDGNILEEREDDPEKLSDNERYDLPSNRFYKKIDDGFAICDMSGKIVFKDKGFFDTYLNFYVVTRTIVNAEGKTHITKIYDKNFNYIKKYENIELCNSIPKITYKLYFHGDVDKIRYYKESDNEYAIRNRFGNTIHITKEKSLSFDFYEHNLVVIRKEIPTKHRLYGDKIYDDDICDKLKIKHRPLLFDSIDNNKYIYGLLDSNGKLILQCKYKFDDFIFMLVETNKITAEQFKDDYHEEYRLQDSNRRDIFYEE